MDETVTCRECHKEQEIVLRPVEPGMNAEFYEHEGHCPACGEYVSCVTSCIAKDEKEAKNEEDDQASPG